MVSGVIFPWNTTMLNKLRRFWSSIPSRLYGSRIAPNRETITRLHSSAKVVPMANLEILESKLARAREQLPEVAQIQRKRLMEDQDDYRPIG